MKTIKQWLNELPEPYRSLAINNTHTDRFDEKTASLYNAVSQAFVWACSPQGHSYWQNVRHRVGLGEFNPPTADPFNLEAAKAGKPVQMKNGTRIKRILAYDLAFPGYPLLVSWEDERGYENTERYTADGKPNLHGSCCGDGRDLVMTSEEPKTVTKWVNVYRRPYSKELETGYNTYETEEQALKHAKRGVILFHVGAFPVEITL